MAGSGRKRENYATLHNILQSKKCKEAGAKKYRAGTGIEGYGKREVQTPLSPPPPHNTDIGIMITLLCVPLVSVSTRFNLKSLNNGTQMTEVGSR